MAQPPRAGEIITGLTRLGYEYKPAVGDHVDLFKVLTDHPCPCPRITLHTGLDGSVVSKKDVSRIQRQTALKDGDLWDRMIAKDLPEPEYREHLRRKPHEELVEPWFTRKIQERHAELTSDG